MESEHGAVGIAEHLGYAAAFHLKGGTAPVITLVLGGTRSGKSQVAESLAGRSPLPVTYVATGRATDEEMAARIAAHQARRPAEWSTVEAGDDLPGILCDLSGTALIDSLGTWIAGARDMEIDAPGFYDALDARSGDTIVVSEEVGLGVHPPTDAGRRFADILGTLNQAVADVADTVWLVIAGRVLPLERGDTTGRHSLDRGRAVP